MESENKNKEKKVSIFKDKKVRKQFRIFVTFSILMIILNIFVIQYLNYLIAPIICANFGDIPLIDVLYCSDVPIKMSEFVGSILAIGITFIVKYFLDKFITFKTVGKIKETSIEFSLYFLVSILASLWNLATQIVLSNLFYFPLLLSSLIALSTGYLFRFPFDRKYVFTKIKDLEEE